MPDTAQWCPLCLSSAVKPAEQSPAPAEAEVAATSTTAGGVRSEWQGVDAQDPPASAAVGQPNEAHETTAQVQDEPVEDWWVKGTIGDHTLLARGRDRAWQCSTCGNSEWLQTESCGVCGTSLFSAVQVKPQDHHRDVAKTTRWAVIPGGGQWFAGLKGQGALVLGLVLMSFAAAFVFPPSGPTIVGFAGFLLFGIGIWLVAARDARVLAATGSDQGTLLRGRRLFWVGGFLLGMLLAAGVLALISSAMSGGSPS